LAPLGCPGAGDADQSQDCVGGAVLAKLVDQHDVAAPAFDDIRAHDIVELIALALDQNIGFLLDGRESCHPWRAELALLRISARRKRSGLCLAIVGQRGF